MSDGYAVQINVKVGDHLINIQGDTTDEVLRRLTEVADAAPSIHADLEKLDGRPATEVVQKEKQWGGRSQYGRSYPKSATASSTQPSTSNPTSAQTTSDPTQLLKDHLGAVVVGQEPTSSSTTSQPSMPASETPVCKHGERLFRSGTSSKGPWTGWFCQWPDKATQCPPVWGN